MMIKINPVAKPRMTRADKWQKRPAVVKYRAFCDELRLKHGVGLPEQLYLVFYIPMPDSWSQKKKDKMFLQRHQQRPDIDNLIKSVLDALCEDDSHIWSVYAFKVWSFTGQICIEDASEKDS